MAYVNIYTRDNGSSRNRSSGKEKKGKKGRSTMDEILRKKKTRKERRVNDKSR